MTSTAQNQTFLLQWAKAFIIYFVVVVALHSLVEYLYYHTVLQISMYIMGLYIPSAYIYGVTLGLVLSIAHFVLGHTFRESAQLRVAEPARKMADGTKKSRSRKKKARR